MKVSKRFWSACAIALAACAMTTATAAAPADAGLEADTLLVHGHIYTGDPAAPWAEALGVTHAAIVAVGRDRDILARRRRHSRVIDLHGRTVVPGIVDSHMHLLYGAYALHGLNLSTPEG